MRSIRTGVRTRAMVLGVATVVAALALTVALARGAPAGSALTTVPSAGVGAVAPGPRVVAAAAAPALTTAPAVVPRPLSVPGLALVPIVGFWSPLRSLSMADVRAALAGRDPRFRQVLVADPDLAALEIGLKVRVGPAVRHLGVKAVIAAVKGHRDVLGFIRAADVRPAVRALGVAGRTLFGNTRVRAIGDWPLTVPALRQAGLPPPPGFDPGATWTLVAAGDVMNDREVYRRTVLLGRGPDFPWNGGTARIVQRSCCSAGLPFVRAVRTGGPGAVRALFRDADLALVNHEGPTPDRFRYHPTGLVFTFDPRLEVGIRHAGVDVVSLANNHIRNAGSAGVSQTIRNVKAAGLVPVGAGAQRPGRPPAGVVHDRRRPGRHPGVRRGRPLRGRGHRHPAWRGAARPGPLPGRHQGRPGGRCGRRDRRPPLGRRVHLDTRRPPSAARPRRSSPPEPTSSSARTRTGPERWKRSATAWSSIRWATSSSTCRAPSRPTRA